MLIRICLSKPRKARQAHFSTGPLLGEQVKSPDIAPSAARPPIGRLSAWKGAVEETGDRIRIEELTLPKGLESNQGFRLLEQEWEAGSGFGEGCGDAG